MAALKGEKAEKYLRQAIELINTCIPILLGTFDSYVELEYKLEYYENSSRFALEHRYNGSERCRDGISTGMFHRQDFIDSDAWSRECLRHCSRVETWTCTSCRETGSESVSQECTGT